MGADGFPTLSLLVLAPLMAAVVIALVPRRHEAVILPLSVALSAMPLGVALFVLWDFEVGEAGFQFTEQVSWFEPLGISWAVGIDGISLLLVVLTAVLFPISLLASVSVRQNIKMYMVAMMVLETGLLGVFLSLDLVLFFVFFELTLIPMYLLIGMWGSERRVYAAIKFVLYTALGSGLLLAGIIFLAITGEDQLGRITFDFRELLTLDLSRGTQMWLFLAFGAAFAIKVPLFPFHTWLPDAHTEAPTAVSVLLAGVLLKLGTYGFLRFNLTLFPDATVRLAPWLAGLAVVGIIYGAVVATVQPDIKRLVAYSSVSHLGFVVLGLFALTSQGLQGGVIQMVNHGLTTGALFLLVGMLYDRRHTRQIDEFGGLARVMPLFAGFFLFTAFASIGLPGLNGFVGEFKVLVGSYITLPGHAIVAAFGVVLAAVYLLWAYERMFTGPVTREENERLPDLSGREIAILVPIGALILFLGIYPKPALDRIEPSVERILNRIEVTTDFEVPEPGRLADLGVPPGGEE
jgi:NADH-quinone oxidoreductase subunit M